MTKPNYKHLGSNAFIARNADGFMECLCLTLNQSGYYEHDSANASLFSKETHHFPKEFPCLVVVTLSYSVINKPQVVTTSLYLPQLKHYVDMELAVSQNESEDELYTALVELKKIRDELIESGLKTNVNDLEQYHYTSDGVLGNC